MKKEVHKAIDRGSANHGWLNAKHSFSFGNYYNPNKMGFGTLRVLNDDTVAAKTGFGKHPHDNMEIITIPLSGEITHRDSMGNEGTITSDEIQVMSAGTGIFHSEMNQANEELKLFQIWITPKIQQVTPRYQQIQIDSSKAENAFLQLVSPDPNDAGVWIHQDAWIHLIHMDQLSEKEYHIQKKGNGVFIMNIDGEAIVAGENLDKRDAIGVTESDSISILAIQKSSILVIEVPMADEHE